MCVGRSNARTNHGAHFKFVFVKNNDRKGADGRWSEGVCVGRSNARANNWASFESAFVKNDGRERVDGSWCVAGLALF